MKRETFTVVSGYTDRNNPPRHWVYLHGHARPVEAAEPIPESAAVVVRDGKAVRASS